MAVCGRVPQACCCLHGDGHRFGTVQAVRGVVEAPTQAVRRPQGTMGQPALVVGILGGLGAALGRHGDEGLRGGAGWHRRGGLLKAGGVRYR